MAGKIPRFLFIPIILTIFTAIILPKQIYGDQDKNIKHEKYYENYTKELVVKPFLTVNSLEFTIETKDKTQSLTYKPNVFTNYGVSLAWWIFGLSISSQTGNTTKDETLYGESKYFDIRFNYYGKHFSFDFNAAQYKNFYIENSDSFTEGAALSPQKYLLNGLTGTALGLNLYWNFNGDKLSIASGYEHTARQRRSQGAFLLMLSFYQIALEHTSPIIPTSLQADFGELGAFTKGEFGTLAIMPGYTFQLVWKNFYFMPIIFLGIGTQVQKFTVPDVKQEIQYGATVLRANIRLSLGYNGRKFFGGFMLINDINNVNNKKSDMSLTAQMISISFFMGYRFFDTQPQKTNKI